MTLDFRHGMTTRAANIITNELGDGPITPAMVSKISMRRLLSMGNCGKVTVAEIRAKLRTHGLDLQDAPEEDATARWIAITDDKAKHALDRWDDPAAQKTIVEWVYLKLEAFAENRLPLPGSFAKLVLKILEDIIVK